MAGAAEGTCPPGSWPVGPRAVASTDETLKCEGRFVGEGEAQRGPAALPGPHCVRGGADPQTPAPPTAPEPACRGAGGDHHLVVLFYGRLAVPAAPLQERVSVRRPARWCPSPCTGAGRGRRRGVGAVGGLATFSPQPTASGARGRASPWSRPSPPAPVGLLFQNVCVSTTRFRRGHSGCPHACPALRRPQPGGQRVLLASSADGGRVVFLWSGLRVWEAWLRG